MNTERRNTTFVIVQLLFLIIATIFLWLSAKWTALCLLFNILFVVACFRKDIFSRKVTNSTDTSELDEINIVNESKTNIASIEQYQGYTHEIPANSYDVTYKTIPLLYDTEEAYRKMEMIRREEELLPGDAIGNGEIDDSTVKSVTEINNMLNVVHNPDFYKTEEKEVAAATITDIYPTTLMQDLMESKDIKEKIVRLMKEVQDKYNNIKIQ